MSTPKATPQAILEQVLSSLFFKKSMRRASRMSRNLPSILRLLQQTLRKTNTLGASNTLNLLRMKIVTLSKMLKLYAIGEYRELSTQSLLIILATLVYFVLPIDLVPDFLPMVGFADDIALVVFIFQKLQDEIESFERWEKNKEGMNSSNP